jgi:hypothetical protein
MDTNERQELVRRADTEAPVRACEGNYIPLASHIAEKMISSKTVNLSLLASH